jgi:hypothetical protein
LEIKPVADTPTPAPAAAAPEGFNIELPACFYLGREYDLQQRAVLPDRFVMYDARDLTTHGVIVGMTGSGKTGLAICLLEEAGIDNIPCIIIDPKGDLSNLLLQFPDFDAQKIAEWINPQDAQQKKLTPLQYAEDIAARWKRGLEETHQKPERVRLLKEGVDQRIYTPGSQAGLPLSVLGSFSAPQGKTSAEDLTHRAEATAAALLALTGISSDPLQSREHILVSQLLLHAWGQKRDLDLPRLILEIQNPPLKKMGAYSLETFFPAKERLRFASTLNNVLAAPGFASWTTGESLDLQSMLYRNGKAQQVIFSIAHLNDEQRMFFTTLLLEEVLHWTRRQPGTTDLRALVYFDEVFGYLPPRPANPPSKTPLLTLLKQARAFGVGILLATQNPVDLDYKALSNAGTWFIGKLQTQYDKMRLLDGLETVAAEQGSLSERSHLEAVISSLGNRIFLMHDIHRLTPVVFQTRWSLSLLRGPLSLEQVSTLMKDVRELAPPQAIPLCIHCGAEIGADTTRCPACGQPPLASDILRAQDREFRAGLVRAAAPVATLLPPAETPSATDSSHLPPVLPHDVTQFYLAPSRPVQGPLTYQPQVLGCAEIAYLTDRRQGKEHKEVVRLRVASADPGHPVPWERAQPSSEALQAQPRPGARWGNVPAALDTGRKLKSLRKAFADWLYSTRKLTLWQNRKLKLVSEPAEARAAFQKRCIEAARAEAQHAVDLERARFGPKFEALGMKIPAAPSGGGSIFSLDWLGSLFSSSSSDKESSRQQEKQRKLEGDYLGKLAEIREKWKRIGEESEAVEIKPRKTDILVTHFGLAWVPG